ncbi:hypothetical protein BT67DRAFT_139068 [Trichocladium antarcticum]|uniref:Uncharacterized protein n=1 Tax=Trichocladium antarcticum TaxID=1450529 RepID=A0AAN6UFQ8_9PEZI|nr:hypothetical protein BT67DRAFT_139068 [Trichocladium antarcticum]
MSIARAFTTRRAKQSLQNSDVDHTPQRGGSKKGSIRHKISSPLNLIHTTNMLSYNAPDIHHPLTASSTGSSRRSDDDMSDSAVTSGSTPPTSPDIASSPKRSLSPAPNHLSCFFTVPGQTPGTAAQFESTVGSQWAPSQAKKSYSILQRQRTTSDMSQRSHSTQGSASFSRSSSSSTRTSATSNPPHHRTKLSGTAAAPPTAISNISPPRPQRKDYPESQHPFGHELAQVSEIAEEYGVREHVVDVVRAEQEVMLARGLLKFSADEYMSEVSGLFATFFPPPPFVQQNAF